MITEVNGNLLTADVDALVNTVNTVGVMGKGIAYQFRRAFPAMFDEYRQAAKAGEIHLGRMHIWRNEGLTSPRYVINFPTKRHWKSPSRLADIESGLADLTKVLSNLDIRSVAVPPLGCGNGGLNWNDVEPIILKAFASLPNLDVRLYLPAGAPSAPEMLERRPRPAWSPGKAALVRLIAEYGERALDVSLIEVQKLMYFLQVAGEQLRLNYEKSYYGPYAENLQQVLRSVEGHFLVGYGDGSSKVSAAEPIAPLPGIAEEAADYLHSQPETGARIDRVLDLADGYESAYSMELLSNVHWVATVKADPATDVDEATKRIAEWTPRKARMFTRDHIDTAWKHLAEGGWLPTPGRLQ